MDFLAISKFLMVIILPFLLFLIVLNFVVFDSSFYQEKFLEYKVQQDVSNATYLHDRVINFIKGKNNGLPSEFNEKEIQHLWDVRKVIRISTILLYTFIILFVLLLIASAFMLKINNYIINFVGKIFIFGGILTIILSLALFLFIASDFLATFESFHKILFVDGSYVFDPSKDTIVRLYPEQLFMDLGIRISKWVTLLSAFAILFGAFLIFKSKRINKGKNSSA